MNNLNDILPNSILDAISTKGLKYRITNNITGEITVVDYQDDFEVRGLIESGCGDLVSLDPNERQFPRLAGRSYTSQSVCRRHLRICESACGRVLCIAGNADGFLFDDGSTKKWLCIDHYNEAVEEWKKKQFNQGFWSVISKSWHGFVSTIFGSKH